MTDRNTFRLPIALDVANMLTGPKTQTRLETIAEFKREGIARRDHDPSFSESREWRRVEASEGLGKLSTYCHMQRVCLMVQENAEAGPNVTPEQRDKVLKLLGSDPVLELWRMFSVAFLKPSQRETSYECVGLLWYLALKYLPKSDEVDRFVLETGSNPKDFDDHDGQFVPSRPIHKGEMPVEFHTWGSQSLWLSFFREYVDRLDLWDHMIDWLIHWCERWTRDNFRRVALPYKTLLMVFGRFMTTETLVRRLHILSSKWTDTQTRRFRKNMRCFVAAYDQDSLKKLFITDQYHFACGLLSESQETPSTLDHLDSDSDSDSEPESESVAEESSAKRICGSHAGGGH